MKFFSALLLVLLLTGCTGQEIQQYSEVQPAFNAEAFFSGPLTAHGVLKDRRGNVTRYFNASINAYWKNGVGTLEERFEFNDGEIQFRNWTLTAQSKGHYVATAGDVLGEGNAETAGNAFHLDYKLQIPYKGKALVLAVDDWMFRVSDKVVGAKACCGSRTRKVVIKPLSINSAVMRNTQCHAMRSARINASDPGTRLANLYAFTKMALPKPSSLSASNSRR